MTGFDHTIIIPDSSLLATFWARGVGERRVGERERERKEARVNEAEHTTRHADLVNVAGTQSCDWS